jgi:hypothetical protein
MTGKLILITLLLHSSGMPAARLSLVHAQAVTSERESGISLYEKEDYQAAAKAFSEIVKQQKDDLVAWHYLGLAMEKLGRRGEAPGPLNFLADGLTANSIRAARQIRFVPAMKDGKPVSMFMLLEYPFNLY